jgi:hypothetical protein
LLISVAAFAGFPHKSTSVLSTGTWYKISITETGIHRITYEDLLRMGFDLSRLKPEMIRVYGNGGGMLPESNATSRIDDLREISIEVSDGGDGKMDPGDYILFYGESPDPWTYDYSSRRFLHSKNLYSTCTYYFINADLGAGKRIVPQASLDSTPNSYSWRTDAFMFHELEQRNLIRSGRTWYGEEFGSTVNSRDFTFSFPDVDNTSGVRIVTDVAARSTTASKFYLACNNNLLDSLLVDPINPQSTSVYASARQKVTLVWNPAPTLNINLTYKPPLSNSTGWLNYLELSCKRYIRWIAPQMSFRDESTIGPHKITQFTMTKAVPGITLWNVSNPGAIAEMGTLLSHDSLRFIIHTDSLKEFIAFDRSFFYPVTLAGPVTNQDLHALQPATLVIVANPLFLAEANRLAEFHRTQNNLSVLVVSTPEIFNEFAGGQPDLTGIRDFVKMLYDRGADTDQPKYLLLFGDGSYDPLDRVPGNNNLVPAYESRESLSGSASYVTDDYYGIMGDNEGESAGGSIEIGIGRFPVTTTDQAKAMVDKIIRYAAVSDTTLSDWRNTMTFVADDENQNLHMHQAEQLTTIVKTQYPVFNVKKVYLDAYPLVTIPAGERFPEANKAINLAVKEGSLFINYTGHGGEDGWSFEKVLTVGDIEAWNNSEKLPVFITATCEFSRFDNPERYSAGEMVVNHPGGGAIALYSTTRLAQATNNIKLDTSFFRNLIAPAGSPEHTMGDLIRISKNNNSNITSNRNFVLLGDPAQHIAFPKYYVVTTEINGKAMDQKPDTAIGLSRLRVKGEVRDAFGVKISEFNGMVYPRLYDKPVTYTTLGNRPTNNESYPQPFQIQNSLLYSGAATVTGGNFEFSCIVPKDINLQFGQGKISYYTRDDKIDAAGFTDQVIIGGWDPAVNPVNNGPAISLYMDNTDFISGGRTGKNTELLAFLSDSSGINSFGLGIGHEIIAVLDDNSSHTLILNDYFTPDPDSYSSGLVRYPFENLSGGLHTISVKAWDLYNNSSVVTTRFFVQDLARISLQEVFNYPNPFRDNTTFQFNPGQDVGTLDVRIEIFTVTGQPVRSIETTVAENGVSPVIISWDGTNDYGSRLTGGIYLYRVIANGANGTFTQTSQKLVILN